MAPYKDILLLVDKVSAPLRKIQENTEKARGKLGRFQDRLRKIGTTLRNVGGRMGAFARTVGKAFLAVGAAIIAVGSAIIRGAQQVAEFGDRIDKMSQKIGMSRKAFQEWDYIMSQNGGNVESLQMGFKTLVTQIDGVRKGSKDSISAFKALGVVVKDNNGQFRSADDIFNDTIRALQKIKNPTEKMILANRLFGRSASELRPLLNQDAEAVDNLREKANKMGLIISDEDVDNSVKFKDTMDTFGRVFQAKFATTMMKLMPSLTKGLEDIMQIAEENQDVFDALGESIKWIVGTALPAVIRGIMWVVNLIKDIGGWIGDFIGEIASIPIYIEIICNTLSTRVRIAFIKIGRAVSSLIESIKQVFTNIFNYISDWVQNIIDKVVWIAGKIPGVNKLINEGTSKINQVQNNNTTNTTNTTNNYYGGGGLPNMTPLSSSIYVY